MIDVLVINKAIVRYNIAAGIMYSFSELITLLFTINIFELLAIPP